MEVGSNQVEPFEASIPECLLALDVDSVLCAAAVIRAVVLAENPQLGAQQIGLAQVPTREVGDRPVAQRIWQASVQSPQESHPRLLRRSTPVDGMVERKPERPCAVASAVTVGGFRKEVRGRELSDECHVDHHDALTHATDSPDFIKGGAFRTGDGNSLAFAYVRVVELGSNLLDVRCVGKAARPRHQDGDRKFGQAVVSQAVEEATSPDAKSCPA